METERRSLPTPPVDLTIGQKMLSALSGSILTSFLVTPLDVVRIRLQSQQSHAPHSTPQRPMVQFNSLPYLAEISADLGLSSCCRSTMIIQNSPSSQCLMLPTAKLIERPRPLSRQKLMSTMACAMEESQKQRFTSTLDGLFKIARNEGPQTLWRGLTPTLLMAVPSNVIYYSGYDWLRSNPNSLFNQHQIVSPDYVPLVAGSSARILSATTISPIEMFRTRLQATPTSSGASPLKDTLAGMQTMVRTQGVFSLWRGLTLTLWRDAPFSALYWFNYENFRSRLLRFRHLDGSDLTSRFQLTATETLVDSFLAGAASGGIASVLTQPFDVGKTRKQVFTLPYSAKGAAGVLPEELPMLRFIWHIFQNHGLPGLFQGGTARLLKVAPSCAIMISTYEIGKALAFRLDTD